MIELTFTLLPFPAPYIPNVSLTGTISLENNVLSLHYSLAGDAKDVLLPTVSLSPSRKDDLWKGTCFEFFLTIKDQPSYWEFNMSPSGDWNVYRMDAYRRVGFREESKISQTNFAFTSGKEECSLDTSVDLSCLFESKDALQIAISAIIQTVDGKETYWALTHPASYADFHLRESFILELAGQTRPSPQSALDG